MSDVPYVDPSADSASLSGEPILSLLTDAVCLESYRPGETAEPYVLAAPDKDEVRICVEADTADGHCGAGVAITPEAAQLMAMLLEDAAVEARLGESVREFHLEASDE